MPSMEKREILASFAVAVACALIAGFFSMRFTDDKTNMQNIPPQDAGHAPLKGRVQVQAQGRTQDWADGRAQGQAEGRVQGQAEGRAQGQAEGRVQGQAEGRAQVQAEDRAQNLIAAKPEGPLRRVVVPTIMQLNSSLAVPVLVNNRTMATFLVDTGASYTVITPRMAKKLGMVITADTPRISMATANGVVQSPLVTLDKIAIGQVEVENIQVVVQPLGGANDVLLAGLLGMNFFKNMDLTVRQNKLVLDIHDE